MKKIKNNIIYLGLKSLQILVLAFPWRLTLKVGAVLGWLFYCLVPKEVRKARKSISIAFPEISDKARGKLIPKVFMATGKNALEFLKLTSMSTAQIAKLVEEVIGWENIEKALAKGKGVLCFTAHLGNWEIIPIMTAYKKQSTAVIAQKLYDTRLDDFINNFRKKHKIKVIQRGKFIREIMRCLKKNMLLGILNDQATSVDSRWIPFFGNLAKTPIGTLRLARRTGAAVVPIFINRKASGKHRLVIEKAVEIPKTISEEEDLLKGANLCNQIIERYIREFPEQWVWFHERWKDSPTIN